VQVVEPGPQSIPGSLEVTVPRPLPAFVSVSVGFLKVAEIDRAAFMVTVQVEPETVSHPPQPMKLDPSSEAAVRATTVLRA
jgi:hypothetical protein